MRNSIRYIILSISSCLMLSAQNREVADSLTSYSAANVEEIDSLTKPMPGDGIARTRINKVNDDRRLSRVMSRWRAIGEVVGINLGVWSFDHFVMKEDFADISIHSIRNNLDEGFGWDNDKFVTNLFAHPYHGSLYYNAGRTNGLGFVPSAMLAYSGSMMWELFMEVEPPSINDLCATTLGGSALGEISYRVSDLILDNRTVGCERTVREILAGIVNPVRFFNRLLDGEAFRPATTSGQAYPGVPCEWRLSTGIRFLEDYERARTGTLGGTLQLSIAYGDPYAEVEYAPYDWFRIRGLFNLSRTQPVLGEVNILAPLWSKRVRNTANSSTQVGIFQHFDYYNSGKTSHNREDAVLPYRLSQVAAYGGGALCRMRVSPQLSFDAECYLTGVVLGASLSDYYHHENRDYNIGSGFSSRSHFGVFYNDRWRVSVDAELYHLFSWVGYLGKGSSINYNKVQGEKSHSRLLGIQYAVSYSPARWFVSFAARHLNRNTRYYYLPNVKYATNDLMVSLGLYL